MMKKKIELLAPAGNYESFIGALHAGADAVYLGGEKFGARAFADNFDEATLCGCIRYAHLLGKKVYLTLNTLIKQEEFSEVYDYIRPFYEAGLDAVIVQDFGVLAYLKRCFQGMELHASTQMAVTGSAFVSLCKEMGISRVVPARELSLEELRQIKDAGIEVEAFIHGAMCYCYSGMCLMSSVLGGRSGNRGKCAQPCRLPYDVTTNGKLKKDTYTLSLKDMCTIEHIGELIEAGIDSFKIEGRMKRSEYAAGVTALYRKYIDIYLHDPDKKIKVSKEDQTLLENLYARSELQDGYLYKNNGKEMITSDKPSYNQVDDTILESIRNKYILQPLKIPVSIYAYFSLGEKAMITVTTEDGNSVTRYGDIVEEASNKPATIESVRKQLEKLGNTHFELEDIYIEVGKGVFLPNSVLNQLRRSVIHDLEEEIISKNFPELRNRVVVQDTHMLERNKLEVQGDTKFQVTLKTIEQCQKFVRHAMCKDVEICFLEHDLFVDLLDDIKLLELLKEKVKLGLALPYITRNKNHASLMELVLNAKSMGIIDVLVRNVESLALVQPLKANKEINVATDTGIYTWNVESLHHVLRYANSTTLPYELGQKERVSLKSNSSVQVAYGYIPIMITANCIYKTNEVCNSFGKHISRKAVLRDRYQKEFLVLTDCKYCYNIILNSVPLSLHNKLNPQGSGRLRLNFSIESGDELESILDFYMNWKVGNKKATFPCKDFTTVHENRRVE